MIRAWITLALIVFAIAAARAMPVEQQIILFGGNSSASSPPLVPCTSTGVYDLSNVCNDIYFIGALK